MIGHLMMKKKLKQQPTWFIGVLGDGDEMLTVDNETGSVWIEIPGDKPKQKLADSLAEFINRRVSSDDMGLKGALQTAIDESGLNQSAMQETFNVSNYERAELINISPRDTGVGIPGYLTQADLLKSIAPVITVRSDTFIVRAYGETKDAAGNVTASATIEAIVQRVPEFIDQGDSPNTPIAELSALNSKFGRRLQIVSFRFLTREESQSNSTT